MNIISIFSGRKTNLEILTRYLNVALDLHIINEVHLWNYARNPDDEIFIKDLCNTNTNFYFFDTNDKTNWKDYYYHYCDARYENDVIIKCDDDIVFIDVLKLPNYINFIRLNDFDLVFANTINNGVSAFIQQNKYNLIPKEIMTLEYPLHNNIYGMCGSLWDSGPKAEILHNYFIDNYHKFITHNYDKEIIQINSRFSINFFGYKAKNWHKIKECWPDDENLLTTDYVLNRKFINVFYSDFYVSHLSFYRQIETGINLDKLRIRYKELCDSFIDKVYNQI
jgi:hypothetical protein